VTGRRYFLNPFRILIRGFFSMRCRLITARPNPSSTPSMIPYTSPMKERWYEGTAPSGSPESSNQTLREAPVTEHSTQSGRGCPVQDPWNNQQRSALAAGLRELPPRRPRRWPLSPRLSHSSVGDDNPVHG